MLEIAAYIVQCHCKVVGACLFDVSTMLGCANYIIINLFETCSGCQENAGQKALTSAALRNEATVKNLSVSYWTFFANPLQHYICGKLKPKCPVTRPQFFCILDIKICNILVI